MEFCRCERHQEKGVVSKSRQNRQLVPKYHRRCPEFVCLVRILPEVTKCFQMGKAAPHKSVNF